MRSSSSNGPDLPKLTSDAAVPRPQDPALRALARLSDGTCNLFAPGVSMARAWLGFRAYEPGQRHVQREDARLKKEFPTLNSKLRRKKISKLYAVHRRRLCPVSILAAAG